jgi:hypothetical protein
MVDYGCTENADCGVDNALFLLNHFFPTPLHVIGNQYFSQAQKAQSYQKLPRVEWNRLAQ